MFGTTFGRPTPFSAPRAGLLSESVSISPAITPRNPARYVPYLEEQAVKFGLIYQGQTPAPEHLFEMVELATDSGDRRLLAEATNALQIYSMIDSIGDGRCADCGGVTCGGKGLGEGAEFAYVPAFDLEEGIGNPWHNPTTGQFGRPNKALASFKFKKHWSKGKFKYGVNASTSATQDIGKTTKVRGKNCGCKVVYPSGGCKTKHAAVCRELAFGQQGKDLAKAVSMKRAGNKAAKALDAARAKKLEMGYKRSLAALAAAARRKAAS